MPDSEATLRTTKAAGYFNSLCRHFARKVAVERDLTKARIHFPMGECLMSIDEEQMHFQCRADDAAALEAVKSIVADHALRYGELRGARMQWSDA